MTILSMLRVIERTAIFPPGILSPSLNRVHVISISTSRPSVPNNPFLFLPSSSLLRPLGRTYCRNSLRRPGAGGEPRRAQGQWQWVSRANRVPRPPKAAPNSKRASRGRRVERERERRGRERLRRGYRRARSLGAGTVLRSRSGDVASRLRSASASASIPVAEPVHAGKRTDKTGMRAGLDRISAYRHVPRSTSRVTLPTRTTPRRFIRPVRGIRRCDADQHPSVPLPSNPNPRSVSFYQIVLQFALLIQLEQTPDSFRVYISANGTEASFVHRFHPLFLGLPSPPLAY